MLIHMAGYCDTPESKDRSNREYKACLREGAIPRLLDQELSGLEGVSLMFECALRTWICLFG